jgi:hypothetical protein
VALGADPERDDMRALSDLKPVEHHHREAHVIQSAAHQLPQRGPCPLDEQLRDRALTRRCAGLLDLLADRLAHDREPACGDAGEHPVHHSPCERVAVGEVLICREPQLALVVGGAHTRPVDLHAPAPQRHRPVLVAVALGEATRVVLALRPDDLIDLELHQLMHNTEPDTDAQREQSLLRHPDELAERLLDLRWERTPGSPHGRDDLRSRYLLHGGSSCPLGLG